MNEQQMLKELSIDLWKESIALTRRYCQYSNQKEVNLIASKIGLIVTKQLKKEVDKRIKGQI